MILSLYSRGMTTRDIHAHLAEIYGAAGFPRAGIGGDRRGH